MYYTKDDFNQIQAPNGLYIPEVLLKEYKSVRLEAKLAYAAILNTALKQASTDDEGFVYVEKTHPSNVENLHNIANKNVDQDKINGYIDELENLGLLEVKGEKVYLLKEKGIL